MGNDVEVVDSLSSILLSFLGSIHLGFVLNDLDDVQSGIQRNVIKIGRYFVSPAIIVEFVFYCMGG